MNNDTASKPCGSCGDLTAADPCDACVEDAPIDRRPRATITYHNVFTRNLVQTRAIVRGGLALHQATVTHRWSEKVTISGWNVTHVQSGAIVVHCASVWKARRAMQELLALDTWQCAIPILFDKPDLSVLPPALVDAARTVHRAYRDPY